MTAPSPHSGRAARFEPAGPLRGRVRDPGDKSISHRALLFAGLAEGTSRIRGLSDGDDVLRTRAGLRTLGVGFEGETVLGGRDRFEEAERPIDVGNSGTGLRLLAGLVSGFAFLTVLQGDRSVHTRPMGRVVGPLREMGASVDGRDGGRLAPLVVRGGGLRGIDHTCPVPSAQVKGAVLLAGLAADGTTTVREAIPTRCHSEEMLEAAGARIEQVREDGAHVVRLRPGPLSPFEIDIPGDPSQAAFLAVAGSIVAGSEVVIERVYVGPGRAGFVEILQRMGAHLELVHHDRTTADLVVRSASLQGTVVQGEEVPGCIDEIPVLAVAAAFAEGTTTFKDAGELRVKESDRIATTVAGLRRIGVRAEERPDGLVVHGDPSLGAAGKVDAQGDHRIAMAFAVAGLSGRPGPGGVPAGAVEIDGFTAVETSWPGFEATIEELLA